MSLLQYVVPHSTPNTSQSSSLVAIFLFTCKQAPFVHNTHILISNRPYIRTALLVPTFVHLHKFFTFVFLSLLIHITFVFFHIELRTKFLCNFVQIIHELLQSFLTVGYHCFFICISDVLTTLSPTDMPMSALSMASLTIVS